MKWFLVLCVVAGCGGESATVPVNEKPAYRRSDGVDGLNNEIHADFDAEDERLATETIQWLGKEWSNPEVYNEVFRDGGYISLYWSTEPAWKNVRVVRSFKYDNSIIRTATECRADENSEWIEHGPAMNFYPEENNLIALLNDRGKEYAPGADLEFVTVPMD